MKTKSALSYFGSASAVAPELGAMLDHCKHVTIGFVGGASELPYIKARAIVANDVNDAVVNFYRHLSDPDSRGRLVEMCSSTLSHPSEIENAASLIENKSRTVAGAWAYWALCWIGAER